MKSVNAMLARMTESNLNGRTWHALNALATAVREQRVQRGS
jgi:hypothetical protein